VAVYGFAPFPSAAPLFFFRFSAATEKILKPRNCNVFLVPFFITYRNCGYVIKNGVINIVTSAVCWGYVETNKVVSNLTWCCRIV
jgi:hypothetical protein